MNLTVSILSLCSYQFCFLDQVKFISQHNKTLNYLNSEKRYQYIKCIATSHQEDELLVAAGQISGKVSIVNFMPVAESNLEFTPRQNRPSLSLAWNEQELNLLAMGFDKNKFDHSISVWDVSRGAASDTSIVNLIGLSESAHSICWDKKNLIAGMSSKYIKMMDLRGSPTALTVNTRAVNGLTMSSNNRLLSSYYENVVNIFDLRKFTEPINQFQLANNLAQISWCPTTENCLLCLQKDSSLAINIIDIHWNGIEDDNDAHFIKRIIAPFEIVDRKNKFQLLSKATALENICWDPKYSNQMLVAASNPSNTASSILLLDLEVPERRIAVFDKWNKLYTPLSPEIREIPMVSPPSSPTNSTNSWYPNADLMEGDISELFQQRILQDYGQMDFERNAKVCMDSSLASVWKMLVQMKNADCFIGLRTILGIDSKSEELTIAQSVAETRAFFDFPNGGAIKVYKSEEREFAMELCDWKFQKNDSNGSLQMYIEELCKKKRYTRAAMLAVFHLRIRLACDILGKSYNFLVPL